MTQDPEDALAQEAVEGRALFHKHVQIPRCDAGYPLPHHDDPCRKCGARSSSLCLGYFRTDEDPIAPDAQHLGG